MFFLVCVYQVSTVPTFLGGDLLYLLALLRFLFSVGFFSQDEQVDDPY